MLIPSEATTVMRGMREKNKKGDPVFFDSVRKILSNHHLHKQPKIEDLLMLTDTSLQELQGFEVALGLVGRILR